MDDDFETNSSTFMLEMKEVCSCLSSFLTFFNYINEGTKSHVHDGLRISPP